MSVADPEIKSFGDVIAAFWPGSKIVCEFTRFTEHRDSLSAELTVSNEVGALHWSRVNLASATGRRDVIRALEEAHPIDGWQPMLNRACQKVAQHLRIGEPAAEVVAVEPGQDTYLVTPWVPHGEITVLYGPGGTAKSLFCLATILSGIMGHTLGSPWAVGHIERALYLDWEASKGAHDQRTWKLLHSIEELPAGRLFHKRLRRPLSDVISEVRTEAHRLKADTVVVDSLGAASGPEPETAGAALTTLQAIGTLPGTKLVIAHESKAALEQHQGKPFGSVYVENTARSTIEMRPQDSLDAGQLTISMRHAKHNDGPKAQPIGLTFTFDESGNVSLSHAKPDPSTKSLAQQILAALPPAGASGRGVAGLSEQLGQKKGSVKSELYRMEGRSKVLRMPGRKGEETQWTRAD